MEASTRSSRAAKAVPVEGGSAPAAKGTTAMGAEVAGRETAGNGSSTRTVLQAGR
jgi:hypothetical protein